MSASSKLDPSPLAPLGPSTTLSGIARARATEPPRVSFTPWLAVVLVVVLFSGGLFGYDQGVISGALTGIKSTFALSPFIVANSRAREYISEHELGGRWRLLPCRRGR
jgi:hypothetical protein